MSPERKAAVEAVEQALDALMEVADREDAEHAFGGVRTAWISVIARMRFEEDGGSSTALRVVMSESMPDWQQVGLLRSGGLLVESEFHGEWS